MVQEYRTRTAVSGTYVVADDQTIGAKFLPDDQHHVGWNKALALALRQMNWPIGQHNTHIDFSAKIDVTNPGNVIEYIVTII